MILWGYEDFVDISLGRREIGLLLGIISMQFRSFLRSEQGHFLVAKISNMFGGMPDIPDIFCVE